MDKSGEFKIMCCFKSSLYSVWWVVRQLFSWHRQKLSLHPGFNIKALLIWMNQYGFYTLCRSRWKNIFWSPHTSFSTGYTTRHCYSHPFFKSNGTVKACFDWQGLPWPCLSATGAQSESRLDLCITTKAGAWERAKSCPALLRRMNNTKWGFQTKRKSGKPEIVIFPQYN